MLRVDLQKKRLIVQENFKNFFRLVATQTINKPTLSYMTTNINFPLFNGVLETRIQESNLDQIIQEITQFYELQKCSYSWWLTSLSQPSNLKTLLEKNNFKSFVEFTGMLYELEKRPIVSSMLPEFEIVSVENISELEKWTKPITVAFQFPDNVSQGFMHVMKNVFVNDQDKLQHFIGYYKGNPVASASIFWDKNSAGLYNLGVLPEYRRLGIATALKIFRLELAKKRNYQYASLQSSAQGFPLDKKLGFEEYLTFTGYSQN